MPTSVRSFSKINLGLAIGPPREDGFHALSTLYQTLALHDVLTVAARRARTTRISLTSSDQRVPLDSRNTVWKIVERTLTELGIAVEVHIHIQKNLPIQGGMGAGSANAAAALLGLERELALDIDPERRLAIAAEVGSDVPLFLVGGSVLGSDRGQVVEQVPDVTLNGQTEIPCVVALPNIGVSTPHAFREWDRRLAALQSLQTDTALGSKLSRHLHIPPVHDTLKKLIRTYASVLLPPAQIWSQQRSPASQISYTGHIRPQANQANGQDPTPAPQALSSTRTYKFGTHQIRQHGRPRQTAGTLS